MKHQCQRAASTKRTKLRGLGISNEAGLSENCRRITCKQNGYKIEGKRKLDNRKQFCP